MLPLVYYRLVLLVAVFTLCSVFPLYSIDTKSARIKAAALLSRMTLDEKIGQMILVDTLSLENTSDITRYHLGAVYAGSGTMPNPNTPLAWANMLDSYQKAALSGRLSVPLLIGAHNVHGNNKSYGATILPHSIGLACALDVGLTEKAGRITALESAAVGFNWTFAPNLSVVRDLRWGRTFETFGENHDITGQLGSSMIKGLQGTNLSDITSVLACARSFAGDGSTTKGEDLGESIIHEDELRNVHIKPFESAIKAGVRSIQLAGISWKGEKIHANKAIITELLKSQLGFTGFVVSEEGEVLKTADNYESQIAAGINAGIDMVMLPLEYKKFIETLKRLVLSNTITQERINDAVIRILTVKFEMELQNRPYAKRQLLASIGSPEHRKIAIECVRASTVLLKNKNNILPLKNIKKIYVVGKNANDIGNQCGGWTIYKQGGWQRWLHDKRGATTTGTSILEAIEKKAGTNASVEYSKDGSAFKEFNSWADLRGQSVIVAVVGERPYAEKNGDRKNLRLGTDDYLFPDLEYQDYNDWKLIANLSKSKIPIILILVSGRPLLIKPELSKSAAFLAVWLPGTEADGIADILFGDVKPTGRLAVRWPNSMWQIPIQSDEKKNPKPLFPAGFGLTYQ